MLGKAKNIVADIKADAERKKEEKERLKKEQQEQAERLERERKDIEARREAERRATEEAKIQAEKEFLCCRHTRFLCWAGQLRTYNNR